MTDLERAILRTILYADVFRFALTLAELHFYLIHAETVTLAEIERTLQQSPVLQEHLCLAEGYITLATTPDYIALRQQREQLAEALLPPAQQYGAWLAQLPFVRMVALTGALAVRNPAHVHDDFDYLLVTTRGRVWLARACSIVLVRLAHLRGIALCPNYILAEDQLVQHRQDLYIAHEVAQMQPLYGAPLYQQLRQLNRWTSAYLPNAQPPLNAVPQHQHWFKRALEWLFSGKIGDWLENWEYQRKQARFLPQVGQTGADARIDAHNVKGHFEDHGYPILRHYQERLQRYGLE
jgi:hypothetical protein